MMTASGSFKNEILKGYFNFYHSYTFHNSEGSLWNIIGEWYPAKYSHIYYMEHIYIYVIYNIYIHIYVPGKEQSSF